MNKWCKPAPAANAFRTILFVVMILLFALPFILAVIVSFSAESSITANGYSFFPSEWSTAAYMQIFSSGSIWRSLLNSLIVTAAGTVLSLFLILTMAYALTCKGFRLKKVLTAVVVIPMFFSGGLAASYVVNTQLFHLKDSLLALILPCACSSWYIFIAKRYFTQSIPPSVIEASKLDGASPFQTFCRIILPLSKPLIATLGVFEAFSYWNSWYYAMLYISNSKSNLYPLQYMLVRIQNSMEAALRLEENVSGVVAASAPSESVRMALLVMIVLPVILLYPFTQKYLEGGFTQGASKD